MVPDTEIWLADPAAPDDPTRMRATDRAGLRDALQMHDIIWHGGVVTDRITIDPGSGWLMLTCSGCAEPIAALTIPWSIEYPADGAS
jgi:hypothetical protein